MANDKIHIKVKKKKLKKKKLLCTILIFVMLLSLIIYIIKLPLKNIYISGNKILSDKEIISLAEIENYPSFILTYFKKIDNKIKKNPYVKSVKVKRSILRKIYITIEEERPLFIYNNELVLSSKEKIENTYNITYIPYINNDITSLYDKFIDKYKLLDDSTILKISEIEYVPNDLDKERFLFKMVDSNYVYINISTMEKLKKYNYIKSRLNGKKGIIYLDSGDYVEIK